MLPHPPTWNRPARATLIGLALIVAGCSSKTPEADTAEVNLDPAVAKPTPAPTPPAAEGAASAPAGFARRIMP